MYIAYITLWFHQFHQLGNKTWEDIHSNPLLPFAVWSVSIFSLTHVSHFCLIPDDLIIMLCRYVHNYQRYMSMYTCTIYIYIQYTHSCIHWVAWWYPWHPRFSNLSPPTLLQALLRPEEDAVTGSVLPPTASPGLGFGLHVMWLYTSLYVYR